MENASKALIMAGGILIALLVLGALLLMFNNLSDYQKSNSDLTESGQLATFNEQFTQYERDDLTGTEVISLANLVYDYSRRSGKVGELDYSQKITLTVKIDPIKFANRISSNPREIEVFDEGIYTIGKDGSTDFFTKINTYREEEEEYSLDGMKKLVSQIEALRTGKDIYGNDVTATSIIGKKYEGLDFGPELVEKLENYQEYYSLKSATFKCNSLTYYNDTGQVKSMEVEFVE